MDFSDETYVRLYVRDTVTWKLLSWESRVVLVFMLRSGFDRSGVFMTHQSLVTKRDDQSRNVTGTDVTKRDDQSRNVTSEGDEFDMVALKRAVAAVTELPLTLVEVGLEPLLAHGIWSVTDQGLVWPRYVEAQTCSRTSRARKTLERQRKVADAASRTVVEPVTKRDDQSRNVTNCHKSFAHVRAPTYARPRMGDSSSSSLDLPTSSEEPHRSEDPDQDLPDRSGSPDSSDPEGSRVAAAAGGPGGDDPVGDEVHGEAEAPMAKAVRGRSGMKIPCPPDLSLPVSITQLLLQDSCPEAVESVRRRFIAKSMSDPDDRRHLRAWRKALVTAVNQDAPAEMRRIQRQRSKEEHEQALDDAASGKRRAQVFDEREFR